MKPNSVFKLSTDDASGTTASPAPAPSSTTARLEALRKKKAATGRSMKAAASSSVAETLSSTQGAETPVSSTPASALPRPTGSAQSSAAAGSAAAGSGSSRLPGTRPRRQLAASRTPASKDVSKPPSGPPSTAASSRPSTPPPTAGGRGGSSRAGDEPEAELRTPSASGGTSLTQRAAQQVASLRSTLAEQSVELVSAQAAADEAQTAAKVARKEIEQLKKAHKKQIAASAAQLESDAAAAASQLAQLQGQLQAAQKQAEEDTTAAAAAAAAATVAKEEADAAKQAVQDEAAELATQLAAAKTALQAATAAPACVPSSAEESDIQAETAPASSSSSSSSSGNAQERLQEEVLQLQAQLQDAVEQHKTLQAQLQAGEHSAQAATAAAQEQLQAAEAAAAAAKAEAAEATAALVAAEEAAEGLRVELADEAAAASAAKNAAAECQRSLDALREQLAAAASDTVASTAELESAQAAAAAAEREVADSALRTPSKAVAAAELRAATAEKGLRRRLEESLEEVQQLQADVEAAELDAEEAVLERDIAREESLVAAASAAAATGQLEGVRLELAQTKAELAAVTSAGDGEASAAQLEELRRQNIQLREALATLGASAREQRGAAATELAAARAQMRQAQDTLIEHAELQAEVTSLRAEMSELHAYVDAAGSYEDMVERLTEQNMALGERLQELKDALKAAVELQTVSDEVERELTAQLQAQADLAGDATAGATALQQALREAEGARDAALQKVHKYSSALGTTRERLRQVAGELRALTADEGTRQASARTALAAAEGVRLFLQRTAGALQACELVASSGSGEGRLASWVLPLLPPAAQAGLSPLRDVVLAAMGVTQWASQLQGWILRHCAGSGAQVHMQCAGAAAVAAGPHTEGLAAAADRVGWAAASDAYGALLHARHVSSLLSWVSCVVGCASSAVAEGLFVGGCASCGAAAHLLTAQEDLTASVSGTLVHVQEAMQELGDLLSANSKTASPGVMWQALAAAWAGVHDLLATVGRGGHLEAAQRQQLVDASTDPAWACVVQLVLGGQQLHTALAVGYCAVLAPGKREGTPQLAMQRAKQDLPQAFLQALVMQAPGAAALQEGGGSISAASCGAVLGDLARDVLGAWVALVRAQARAVELGHSSKVQQQLLVAMAPLQEAHTHLHSSCRLLAQQATKAWGHAPPAPTALFGLPTIIAEHGELLHCVSVCAPAHGALHCVQAAAGAKLQAQALPPARLLLDNAGAAALQAAVAEASAAAASAWSAVSNAGCTSAIASGSLAAALGAHRKLLDTQAATPDGGQAGEDTIPSAVSEHVDSTEAVADAWGSCLALLGAVEAVPLDQACRQLHSAVEGASPVLRSLCCTDEQLLQLPLPPWASSLAAAAAEGADCAAAVQALRSAHAAHADTATALKVAEQQVGQLERRLQQQATQLAASHKQADSLARAQELLSTLRQRNAAQERQHAAAVVALKQASRGTFAKLQRMQLDVAAAAGDSPQAADADTDSGVTALLAAVHQANCSVLPMRQALSAAMASASHARGATLAARMAALPGLAAQEPTKTLPDALGTQLGAFRAAVAAALVR